MRKRRIYQQNKKPKSHIPTIIIMSVALFVILYFGKGMSYDIAGFFAPSVPVTDDMAAQGPFHRIGIGEFRRQCRVRMVLF